MLIRKILIGLLGFPRYLRFISYIFLGTYKLGYYLKAHRQVRFLRYLVPKGGVCIDIGANLGYFSIPLSLQVGQEGKVLAVEPVGTFGQVLQTNARTFGLDNIRLLPFALGENDHQEILMATPNVDGVVRHGRTEVTSANNHPASQVALTHKATMRSPATLFSDLQSLHFIKCDVEGYEMHIFPLLMPTIERFKPVIELEVGPLENKQSMLAMLTPLGYEAFFLEKGHLEPFRLSNQSHHTQEELYFLTQEHLTNLQPPLA